MAGFRLTRKEFIKLSGAGMGAMALGALPGVGPNTARGAGQETRPNILMICMDQLQSWVDLPEALPLPAHERLLREGRGFVNYHVHQAPCGPSRSVMYTGQHIQKTGMYTNPPNPHARLAPDATPLELSPGFPTIGDMLRREGYYTAYKGKWHLSVIDQKVRAASPSGAYPDTSDALEPYGFSDFNHDGDHVGWTWVGFGHDGFIAGDSVNLLYDLANGVTDGKPWFLAVNFINPHDIMFYDPNADDPDADPAGGPFGPLKGTPRIPRYERAWDVPPPESFYKDDLSTKPDVQQSVTPIPREDEAGWREYRNYYFNCVRDVDRHIETVLNALDRFGLAENTVVVLTSDHGERAGAHGLSGKGADIYKETLRMPLIVRHPDVAGGTTTEALGGSVDLAPTLLSFAGVDAGKREDRYPDLVGVDLSPAVADANARSERDKRGILFDYMTAGGLSAEGPVGTDGRRGVIRGIHDGRYKFARYFSVAEHHRPEDWDTLTAHNDLELYDTVEDPDEIVNLAYEPEGHKELILSLNAKVNTLIDMEVGADNGAVYPGDTARYNTLSTG